MIIYDDKQYRRMMRIFKSFNKAHTIVFKVLIIGLPIFYACIAYNFWRSKEWAGLGMSTLVMGLIWGVFWNAKRKYRKVITALEQGDYTVDRTQCIEIVTKRSGDDYTSYAKVEGHDKLIGLESWLISGWHNLEEGDAVDVIEAAGQKFVIKSLKGE